ncbi:hypothetical protein DPMN_105293 [Dreissena polymorpha]|uniref:Uncharacterized protein n=1 Tax=Dreissena polymorpha TaxID=45954 RepID=A0A9D4HEJ7_DREPO|nr:hypothetical protein DPMN_105293 [Dreissena polymorpha]
MDSASVIADIQKEYSRQREDLERSAAYLTKKFAKDYEIHHSDNARITQAENYNGRGMVRGLGVGLGLGLVNVPNIILIHDIHRLTIDSPSGSANELYHPSIFLQFEETQTQFRVY